MYTFVNILYSVNKELNWIELNWIVKQIIRFKASGKIVGVICSSGVACKVFDRGTASTVHSFYGLSTAELPWRQLVDRSLGNSLIRERVKAFDVIIWDEASMSSRRMFELMNFLHHELQPRTKPVETNRENAYFFLSSRQKLKPPPNECPISPLPLSKVV